MFRRLSLQGKLISICALLASLVLLAGTISFWALRDVSQKYHRVSSQILPSIGYLGDMFASSRLVRIHVRTLGLDGITEAQTEKAIHDTEEAVRAYEQYDQKYRSISQSAQERELYENIDKEWKVFRPVVFELIGLAKKTDSASKARIQSVLFKDCPEVALRFQAAMEKMLEFQDQAESEWVGKAESASSFATVLLACLTLASFGLALLIGFLFSRSLSGMIHSIAEQLSNGAEEVASAAAEIAATSEQLSSSATEQAASLQETSSTVEEMSAMVSKNADNSSNSQRVATETESAAHTGKQVVEQMIHAVEEINQSNSHIMSQIEDSNKQISDIVKVIAEIGNKTKVINDIVFQTKLLSFNASVEAARAGEHGKGFAVVAEEVGNLAQMSGNAAKEISLMLEGSILKVESIVEQTRTRVEGFVQLGRTRVETGVLVAKRCGEVLDELVKNVSTVNSMVAEITTASHEQAKGVQEITRAMTQLDQVTQQNSVASQQSASSSEQLATEAQRLRSSVQVLLEAVNGHGTIATQPQALGKDRGDIQVVNLAARRKPQTSAQAPFQPPKSRTPASSDPRFGT